MTMGLSLRAGRAAIIAKPLSMPASWLAIPIWMWPSTKRGEPLAWNDRKSVGVPFWPVA
jgi:hypothetical protein